MDCQIANLTIALRHDDDDDDKVVLLWTEIVRGAGTQHRDGTKPDRATARLQKEPRGWGHLTSDKVVTSTSVRVKITIAVTNAQATGHPNEPLLHATLQNHYRPSPASP